MRLRVTIARVVGMSDSNNGQDIPINAILFNGLPITYNGYYLIYSA